MSIFHVEDGFFWPTKGTGGLKHHNFLIFDEKQHPKNSETHLLLFVDPLALNLPCCELTQGVLAN